MGREDDVCVRLRRAALQLFVERGFDRTTAAEIAAQAGVTERTFFRHFPDKREVLFDGEVVLRTHLTRAVAEAPVGLGPLDILFRAFRSTVPLLEGNRSYAKARYDLIARTPVLHERELAKVAALSEALASALTARGVSHLQAALAAKIGMVAFTDVTIAWLNDPEPGLDCRLVEAANMLTMLLDSLQRARSPADPVASHS